MHPGRSKISISSRFAPLQKSRHSSQSVRKANRVALKRLTSPQKELYHDFDFIDVCEPVDKDKDSVEEKPKPTDDEIKKYYPKDPPPKNISLPFHKEKHELYNNNFLETASLTVGNQIRKLTLKKGISKPPGWLIEIPERYFSHILEIKSVLDSVKDPIHPYEQIDALVKILTKEMKLGVEEDEVCEVLRRIPLTSENKYSFSHFIFGIADPAMAEEKRVFLVEPRKCKCAEDEFNDLYDEVMADLDKEGYMDEPEIVQETSKKKKSEGLPKYGALGHDYLAILEMKNKKKSFQLTKKPTKKVYANGYSPREQILYSTLFFINIYGTMKKFDKMFNRDFIPPNIYEERKRHIQLGFAGDSIGIRKKGFAEWDRIKPHTTKLSPYLHSRILVNNRLKIQKPNFEEIGQQERITRQSVHLIIHPPKPNNPNGPIRVMENRDRVKRTMEFLASEGDCVAKLPDIDKLVTFGNQLVAMFEEIVMNPTTGPKPPEINHSKDMSWIKNGANKMYGYAPFKPIKNSDNLVPVIEGRELREKADLHHLLTWKETLEKRASYRKELWKKLNPDKIPCALKDSFIKSFLTLMPHNTDLTTQHDKNPWLF